MQDEIDSLVAQGTWKLVQAPKGAKIISSKWVHGKFERFKCRVVAKGFMQVYGVNYFRTYAPVASLMTIRVVTTEAFMRDMEFDQLDIHCAFCMGRYLRTKSST
jgi:hypothetical protein